MFRRQFSIAQFPKGGFFVRVMILPGSDEMWVERRHPAVFASREMAEQFMALIQFKQINLANWIGDDWAGSPLRVDESANPAPYSPLSAHRAMQTREQAAIAVAHLAGMKKCRMCGSTYNPKHGGCGCFDNHCE